MSKTGFKSSTSRSQYMYKTTNSSNVQSSSQQQTGFKDNEIDSDFFDDFNPDHSGHIVQQKTERSYDTQGNRITKTKIVREIEEPNPRKNHITKVSKQIKKETNRISTKSNYKNEAEKQRALYLSPDFKGGSPLTSPLFKNDRRDSNDIEEIGYKTNYVYESKKVNGRNMGTYSTNEKYEYINRKGKRESRYEKSSFGSPGGTEIISPVGYIENNSSGSEFEENQIKSLDNFQYSTITNKTNRTNYTKYNKNIKIGKNKLNYELEDPEGFDYLSKNQRKVSNDESKKTTLYYHNRSQIRNKITDLSKSDIKDFQSPDRDVNESKKFRKVNMGMIYSKGPSNDDGKVTKIMTKEVVKTTTDYKQGKKYINKKIITNNYSEDENIRINAAKIIQAWWRKKYNREEEVYDITVKSAVKLQSFIRGFLVRKKVLRYITLAIYYQSFCDKLQDVLCNNVKNEIFKLFKKKYLYNTSKIIQRVSREIIYKRKEILTSIIEGKIEKKLLTILRKWKEIALKLKKRNEYRQLNQSWASKTGMINKKTKNINNKESIHIKEVKIKTIKNSSKLNTSTKNYQTKTYNITKSRSTDRYNIINEYPITSKIPTVRFEFKGVSTPYRYSSSITEEVRKNKYSPNTYKRSLNYRNEYENNYENKYENEYENNYENNYEINVNKSFDNAYYRRDKEWIRYTNILNERKHHRFFNRVEKSKEKDRNISPQFGTLRKNNVTKQINNTKYVDKRKNVSNVNKNIMKTINTNIDTRKTKKITQISKKTPPRVQHPKSINFSESESIYTQRRGRHTLTSDRNNRQFYNLPYNTIDNQLSISIVKLPEEENLNRTTVDDTTEPQKIKIKEKIIIQKEMPPETAEEGNNFQIFDMKISKRVSLFIKPSTELKHKITDEQKEFEIVKKIEREKNKEIDKYKKDIEKHKEKSKLDTLKYAIKTIEIFKKRILFKKFLTYKKKCFEKNLIFEIEAPDEIQINKVEKKTQDLEVQISSPLPQNKEIKSFKILKIANIKPLSYLFKKVEKPQKITNTSKFNIISKVKKKEQGMQSKAWNNQVTNISENSINLGYKKPKTCEAGSQYIQTKNSIGKTKELEIIRNKPKMVDDEVQHEYEDNYIEAESLEIKGTKPIYKDSTSQYEKTDSKITKEKKFSIIQKKKEVKKIETCDAQCNTIVKTEEKGINAVEKVKPKPKNIEVKIRTVKRSLTKMEIPILKKLWLRKAFRTFRENCKRPDFHKILERELLRMALLRWRFIRGYGPDRYGNAYDRDGNFLYKTRGKVADFEIQKEEIIEQNDQGTQYIPIENIISTLKQIEFTPSYKKPEKKITKDASVGNNIRIEEKIQTVDTFNIKQRQKKKPKNYITKDNFGIIKKQKKLVDQETQMPRIKNKIQKLEKVTLTNDDYILRKKNYLKLKELLTKMIYKKIISDKLDLSEALRNWFKKTMILMHSEEIENENQRRRQTKIKKNDRFSLIEKIKKEDAGTQMMVKKNQIETILNFNLIKNIKKKNAEINVDLPPQFDLGKIKPKKENKILFESTKKPLILKTHKENDMNIYSADYIFKEEIRRGIHHPMTEESKTRVTEIFYKFLSTRGDPLSLLRKYFSIWMRKTNYLTLIKNARIIGEFCKRKLKYRLNYKKWKKICEKLLLKERIKLVKLSKNVTIRISKIFDLIRVTRINSVFSKKRFLHFIIVAWLAYTRTIKQKRSHVQTLYENMLNTYMNLADDVFGNNQKENPSVQDALFEAVDSSKFQTKILQDVPLAKEYYEKKKEITKVNTNITYFYGKDNEEEKDINSKEYTVYKSIKSSHPFSNINTTFTTNTENEEKNKFSREKKIEIKKEERLHSRGRGRAYRTKEEKEIIKNYDKNILYGLNKKKNEEIEDNEEKNTNKNIIYKSYKTEYIQKNNDDNEDTINNSENKDTKKMNYRERRRFYLRSKEKNNE